MRYIRGIFFFAFAIAAMALLLFGPRDSGRPRATPGFVEITYWEKWTGNEGAQMQIIVDDFNRTVGQRKKIFVNCLTVSEIETKTLAATAAGVPPDVAGLTDEQIAQFAAQDALQPLDDLAAAHGITQAQYKPVFWTACLFEGRLWALPSTPAAMGLHYNKHIFEQCAPQLRAAGLDPDRAPRTLKELDAYAKVLDQKDKSGKIRRTGYLPMEPGWFTNFMPYWFGATIYDDQAGRFTLTDPRVIQTFEWIRDYSRRLGLDAMTEFKSGMSVYSSAQNPFVIGTVAMEQQGCWMGNFLEETAPAMNRWQCFKREEPAMIAAGISRYEDRWQKFEREIAEELAALTPEEREAALTKKIAAESARGIEARRANYQWAAAPFPSAIPGLENVTYASIDALCIPRGCKHNAEAFEFIAYVNRQDVTEKLNSMQCKISPLKNVSPDFEKNHPNPYIGIFNEMVASPNARGVPRCPIWPEVVDEMNATAQKIYLLEEEPAAALAEAQNRLQERLDQFNARRAARKKTLAGGSR
jgi:ABC-type glycerol-3-phosphate transport system substrate-binding protein